MQANKVEVGKGTGPLLLETLITLLSLMLLIISISKRYYVPQGPCYNTKI